MATMQDLVQAKYHSSKRPKYADAMLPTPTSGNDYRDTKMKPSALAGKHGKSMAGILGECTGMKLQPSFVEYMMGYPIGWTDIDPQD
jgi:hypothetical protein